MESLLVDAMFRITPAKVGAPKPSIGREVGRRFVPTDLLDQRFMPILPPTGVWCLFSEAQGRCALLDQFMHRT